MCHENNLLHCGINFKQISSDNKWFLAFIKALVRYIEKIRKFILQKHISHISNCMIT